jgi:hypothetical protein
LTKDKRARCIAPEHKGDGLDPKGLSEPAMPIIAQCEQLRGENFNEILIRA